MLIQLLVIPFASSGHGFGLGAWHLLLLLLLLLGGLVSSCPRVVLGDSGDGPTSIQLLESVWRKKRISLSPYFLSLPCSLFSSIPLSLTSFPYPLSLPPSLSPFTQSFHEGASQTLEGNC